MNSPPKVQKLLNLLIQLAIFTATSIFIYHQVFGKAGLSGLGTVLKSYMSGDDFQAVMALVLLMMVVNWSLEALKWKFLIGKIEEISFLNALQAVFSGIAVSSIIPNRVGEFFGRVFILKKAGRIEAILISVLGSMSQLLITVVAGSVALLVIVPRLPAEAGSGSRYLFYSLVSLILTLDVILVALFFKISFLARFKERIVQKGLSRLRKFFRVFAFYHNREIACVLMYSLARYLVFSTQFYILLLFFGVQVPYFDALTLIALIYLIMAVIPTISLTELGIRGSVSLYVFGLYFGSSVPVAGEINMGVFAASSLLWIINLGIPALAGTIFVFRLKFFRKTTG